MSRAPAAVPCVIVAPRVGEMGGGDCWALFARNRDQIL